MKTFGGTDCERKQDHDQQTEVRISIRHVSWSVAFGLGVAGAKRNRSIADELDFPTPLY